MTVIASASSGLRVGLSLNTNTGPYESARPTAAENRVFIQRLIDQARRADALGYDGVFVAERHARRECQWPAPLQLLTVLAFETSRVDLVTHVLLLPLHHPCEVAEAAALADVASDGRLVLGVGMGFNEDYFATFGVDIRQRRGRFEESLEILGRAWTGEPFDFRGRYFDLAGAQVLPVPARRPGPPLWIGGQARVSVERAARAGDGWVVAWPIPEQEWRELTGRYREECARRGKDPVVIASRHCWLGTSRDEVERWFAPMWLEEMKYYWRRGQLRHPDFGSEGDFTIENARRHIIMGNADDCAEGLARCADQGIDYVKLSLRLPPGPSMDSVDECIEGIGESVLPKIAGYAVAGAAEKGRAAR